MHHIKIKITGREFDLLYIPLRELMLTTKTNGRKDESIIRPPSGF